MTLFAILFEDEPANAAAIRGEYLSDHLDFLQVSGNFIRAAGPLRHPDESAVGGGLWLVEAQNTEEVERLLKEDPFTAAGLRRSVQVLVWDQVFADGVCRVRQ